MGLTDSFGTPPEITVPLAEFFGGPVGMDPCSNKHSIVQSIVRLFSGGLVLPWSTTDRRGRVIARTVYENPPYSQGQAWTDKALAEMACGNVTELVRLTMMATSTQWWADQCLKAERNPRILGIRKLEFIDPATGKLARWVCRFDPALTYFGPKTELFTRTFAHLTRWSTWGR